MLQYLETIGFLLVPLDDEYLGEIFVSACINLILVEPLSERKTGRSHC